METSAAAKSKKIRDYAALVIPSLVSSWEKGTMDDLVAMSWSLGEKMYEMEMLTYDRVMKEGGCTRQHLAEEFSAIVARQRSMTDALGTSATVTIRRGSEAK